jgi:hypothetical protein
MTVVEGVVLLANTVETTAHRIKIDALSNPISGGEGCNLGKTRRKNAGKYPDNEHRH